ncbi:phosphonate ABC transporter ATP-binding protein [Paenibacillus sp. J5C_2022]|uniref:phosphonate ABC transporter ATP-binding protein n=1 Tax=Paenibacillus sp. J5C2022 TaxID=2977129 RepID=UPI0021D2F548|nr:phosphonate ABC transporter ATP-binding protein [Paenibacillus sp. J5C2022]MCU6708654.1 phosphonate ABC transporter ATP-binding protein [Paenibacillus sp. J5C2022]
MTTLLKLDNVSKQYGKDSWALQDVSFSAKSGEFVSIIGPSGAGKSTMLRCVNRMIEPSQGSIQFQGKETTSMGRQELRRLRRSIGMVFQHFNLVERLSVIENVLHGRLGYKNPLAGAIGIYSQVEKRKAQDILHALGLTDHMFKRCDQLSGGQKQRVGIARALVQEPELLLCDEPIASLDPSASKTIMDHLRSITESMGITVLVNLHQVDVALHYSDTIIGVNGGKVVFRGTPDELTQDRIHHIYGSASGELIMDAPAQGKLKGEAQLAYEIG